MFKRIKLQKLEIGMVISEKGISVVSAETAEKTSKYKHFAAEDWAGLSSWVQQNKFTNKKVHLVLDNKQYQLSQIEPPAVPNEELNSAILYSLRDRLDYKMNEVQIDNFSLPKDAYRGAQKKVNVVTAHAPALKGFLTGIEKAGLKPAVIDIAELAIKNILLDKPNMEKGICFLAYHEKFVTFMIYRNGDLYLTRSVHVNSWDSCINPESDFAREELLLEIQRTLDYYQSQLNQPPIAEIIIPDWSRPLSPLVDYLNDNLTMEVNKVSFRNEDQETANSDELRQHMLAKSALVEEDLKILELKLEMEKNHAEG